MCPTMDIKRQISVHTKFPKPVYSLNMSFEDHESNKDDFGGCLVLYIYILVYDPGESIAISLNFCTYL